MKPRLGSRSIIAISALFFFLALGLWGVIFYPKEMDPHAGHQMVEGKGTESDKEEFWACPMFCVKLDKEGLCPVCGMELERFKDTGSSLVLDERQREGMGIKTSTVKLRYLAKELRTVGMFEPDETLTKTSSAWVSGRIDRVHAGYTGTIIGEGQPLFDLYSPALYVAQKELILAKAATSSEGAVSSHRLELLDIAREKLQLLGLSQEQIEKIEAQTEPSFTTTIQATVDGVVLENLAEEGKYVKEGEPVYRLAELDPLWLMLEIHEKDLSWVVLGQPVLIQVDAYPGREFRGKVGYIYPTLNPQTRTARVRVEVPNSKKDLRPGMFATAVVFSRLAADGTSVTPGLIGSFCCPTHPLERGSKAGEECPICGVEMQEFGEVEGSKPGPIVAVPKSAVLSTGMRHLVYVESWTIEDKQGNIKKDEDGNPLRSEYPSYQAYELILGPLAAEWKKEADGRLRRTGEYYPVLKGIPAGVTVVTQGQFLIDSQMELTGKPSVFFPKGGDQTEPPDPHAHH